MVSAAKASERATELEMRSEGRTEPIEGHETRKVSTYLVVHFFEGKILSCQDFKMSRCVVQDVEMLNRGVHAHSCIMGNEGKMAGLFEDLYWNSKPANSPELKMKVQFLVGRL